MQKVIKSALISVFDKHDLDLVVKNLSNYGVKIYSTGGTYDFISSLDVEVTKVEDVTGYPSILDGRVKTLHPKIFGGILAVREDENHLGQMAQYEIPEIDLVIVDLYPFEQTVKSNASESDIIEKIDIGGISLIRAAAKNYKDVLIVSHKGQYQELCNIIEENGCSTDLETRRRFAREAFGISSNYDSAIFNWFDDNSMSQLKLSQREYMPLRYGENPHQEAKFFGNFDDMFQKLHGKEVSYNNILDIDAGINLIREFEDTTVAILKHNNACGIATRSTLLMAWKDALACDPVSAYGGIIVTNRPIDREVATEINKIFFEVIIAPDFTKDQRFIRRAGNLHIVCSCKHGRFSATTHVSSFLFSWSHITHVSSFRLNQFRCNAGSLRRQLKAWFICNDVQIAFSNAGLKRCLFLHQVLSVNRIVRIQLLSRVLNQSSVFNFFANGRW